MTNSRDPSHFERLYQSNPDPWGFRHDPYEHAKYQHSIDVLEGRRFTAGLEVGCSIGELTRMLATHCDALLALDVVDQALQAAAQRCADLPWVSFKRMQIPQEWPDQRFDLVVLSEVLYFLSPADLDHCAAKVCASLEPHAVVLMVNWLGQTDDPCSGDQAAEHFIRAADGLDVVYRDRRARYRLDLLARA